MEGGVLDKCRNGVWDIDTETKNWKRNDPCLNKEMGGALDLSEIIVNLEDCNIKRCTWCSWVQSKFKIYKQKKTYTCAGLLR